MLSTALASESLDSHTYVLSTWLFLRLLGLVYLMAFASLAVQIKGLLGERGILPVANLCQHNQQGALGLFCQLPTLCWWNSSDRFLVGQTWAGIVLALLCIVGLAPVPVLLALWLLYLSLVNVSGIFLAYQWDALLLESGLLAVFVAPLAIVPSFPPSAEPSPIARWLLVWLLFRLIFSSGIIKLRSGDPTWRNFTALRYHYETQPLPNRVSWYVHHLPPWCHRLSTAIMFVIELIVPCLLFAPAPVSYGAAALIVLLMLVIMATGNYGFFNVLTMVLAVPVFDDRAILSLMPPMARGWVAPMAAAPAPLWWNVLTGLVGLVVVTLSIDMMVRLFVRRGIPWLGWLSQGFARLRPFHLVSSYGLFAVMTTVRPEIIVEGSQDGQHWQAYEFKWKPGAASRPPRFVAPHQPRLDWQMWFAALSTYAANPWFINFVLRLLEGSPEVLRLLHWNPFPDKPPQYVRALLYDYRFTDVAQRRQTGAWWRREVLGLYLPPVTLWKATSNASAPFPPRRG
jgi:hypothetical protein